MCSPKSRRRCKVIWITALHYSLLISQKYEISILTLNAVASCHIWDAGTLLDKLLKQLTDHQNCCWFNNHLGPVLKDSAAHLSLIKTKDRKTNSTEQLNRLSLRHWFVSCYAQYQNHTWTWHYCTKLSQEKLCDDLKTHITSPPTHWHNSKWWRWLSSTTSLLFLLVAGRIDVIAQMRLHCSCTRLCSFNHLVHLLHVLSFVVNIWLPCICFNRISPLWDDADLN